MRLVYPRLLNAIPQEFKLPEPIQAYLAGIRDIKDSNDHEWEIDFLAIPDNVVFAQGLRGSFGQVAANRYIKYNMLL